MFTITWLTLISLLKTIPVVSQESNHPIINALHNINQMKYFKNEAACSHSS